MISKIRKYQDSWLTKAILALTALSFMSLFGITGYVNSANKNRAVIKVDNIEILQDEMNVKLNNSIRKAGYWNKGASAAEFCDFIVNSETGEHRRNSDKRD